MEQGVFQATNRHASTHVFAGLPLHGFDLIMADPPWPFRVWSAKGAKKSPEAKYRTMSIAEIAALPVHLLAAKNSVLILCATYPLLLEGGAARNGGGNAAHSPVGSIMQAWGFRYVSGGPWVKLTRTGKVAFGTGYRARSAAEVFLIGIRGNPLNSRGERNLIETVDTVVRGERREHSRKPEELYAWCERYLPGARRLALFSRDAARRGWTVWGDEVGKFAGPD